MFIIRYVLLLRSFVKVPCIESVFMGLGPGSDAFFSPDKDIIWLSGIDNKKAGIF